MKVKVESEKVGLKLNVHKTKVLYIEYIKKMAKNSFKNMLGMIKD